MKIPSTIITISIPLVLLEKIDKISQQKLMTRSEYIRNCLLEKVNNERQKA